MGLGVNLKKNVLFVFPGNVCFTRGRKIFRWQGVYSGIFRSLCAEKSLREFRGALPGFRNPQPDHKTSRPITNDSRIKSLPRGTDAPAQQLGQIWDFSQYTGQPENYEFHTNTYVWNTWNYHERRYNFGGTSDGKMIESQRISPWIPKIQHLDQDWCYLCSNPAGMDSGSNVRELPIDKTMTNNTPTFQLVHTSLGRSRLLNWWSEHG